MRSRSLFAVAALCALPLVGCPQPDGSEPEPSPAPEPEPAPAVDAGEPDPAPVDAGEPDPAPVDAGEPDPAPVDAGEPDPAPADAGPPPVDDAGPPPNDDAGAPPRDGGTPPSPAPDAGPPPADAGPPPPPPDAGPPADAGPPPPPPDAGAAPDAGPPPGLAEGAPCDVTNDACATGLRCVETFTEPAGTCRVDCGVYGPGGDLQNSDPAACDGDPATRCQVLRALDDPTVFPGAVCLVPIGIRDAVCDAPFDPDACTGTRECIYSSDGVQVTEPRCRDVCNFADADPDAVCETGEVCLPDPLFPDDEQGQCGVAIQWANADDWAAGPAGFPQFKMCDEQPGHRICDRRPTVDLTEPTDVRCFADAVGAAQDRGFCFPICRFPEFDRNLNGTIDSGEEASNLDCPVDFECTFDLGRASGFVNIVRDLAGAPIPCDTTTCPPGEPCPNPCGPGDAECLSFANGPVCVAPIGSCAPVTP